MSNGKHEFLETYDEEHGKTMRVLRAYPKDKLDLRPHPKLKNARELAFVFVLERGLGTKVWHDEFASGPPKGGSETPTPPEDWDELLATLQKVHKDFRDLVSAASDEELHTNVHFMSGPKTMAPISRKDWIWFLLHDQIHHRGQFSIYLRMADGRVPSIYGPTGDEPWI
ncbi:MAG: DinB family protein [Thermoanaerobaculia bacterium]